MKIGLMANPKARDVVEIANRTMEIFGPDADITLENDLASLLGRPGKPIEDLDVDVLITIGGDGTILRALHKNDSPIVVKNG